jgi:hypothetical protein
MILGKLELTEQTDMSFGIDVYGTTEQVDRVRLVIEGPQFDISCHCSVANGEVTATVPKLKGILPAGVYEARLETIVDGKIFVPLKEQIELNPLVEFDVKTKNIKPIKEGVKITTKQVKMTSEDTKKTSIQQAIEEGFEVVKMNSFNVLKKGDLYCGLVSDNKIMKSDRMCNSLSELVDNLSK